MPRTLVFACLLVSMAAAALLPRSAHATDDPERWGWDGHKIVCMIAWWEMDDSARDAVRDLLSDDPEFDRLMESCLWPDQVRGRDAAYDRFTTAHYVNLPRDATSFSLERDCADNLCAVEAIAEMRAVLERADATRKERLDALKFVAHFVGDIHQPLHAGYADDRGGNDTHVVAFGEDSNVHRVWDYVLIDQAGKPWVDYASSLWFDISDGDRKAWENRSPASWAEESYRVVRDAAYEFSNGNEVDRAYYERQIVVVEQRLQMAGIRLGQMLNALFAN